MFGIGANELIIILLFGFLIFGPDKMPAMAKTIGKAIAKFRTAQEEMNNVIRNEVYDPNSDDPFQNPLDALSKVEKKVTREDRGESFTERKARYDKQRAAAKAAKEREESAAGAAAGAATAAAAAKADEGEKHLKGIAESKAALDKARAAQAKQAAEDANDTQAEAASAGEDSQAADTNAAEKKPTADELYGVKPRTRKPSVQKVPPRKPMAPLTSKDVEAKLEEAVDDTSQDQSETTTEEKGE